ncbi:MAG: glycosyltransferase family 4 protein [Nitrospirota bacterium]
MKKVIVAQLGARMHYAVPRILYRAGLLERFYTDICSVKGWPRLLNVVPETFRPAGLRRLAGRIPLGVPPSAITAFTGFGYEYAWRRAAASTLAESVTVHLWAGETFCNAIVTKGLMKADGIYTFNSAGLELLQDAKAKGLKTVMEQTIAPYRIERSIMAEERDRFPGWQGPVMADESHTRFIEREESEWSLADIILCGSDFVRDGIKSCGGPAERCVVVPYGVDARFSSVPLRKQGVPLRILTAGEVGLRKGSPYVMEAARILKGKAHFRMIGPLSVLPEAREELASYIEVRGPVPRAEVQEHYDWADVFLLPSLFEGSATVVYEALSAGLPVITTHNAGSVVREGVDGFIIPVRDPGAIAERVERLSSDRYLYEEMSRNAFERAKEYTVEAYGKRLIAALSNKEVQVINE